MIYRFARRLVRAAAIVFGVFMIGGASSLPAASVGADDPPKSDSTAAEDKAYRDLAEQVADLEKLSRVFETVNRLVGPAVVHIETRRAGSFMDRNFTYQESGSGVIVRLPGIDSPHVLTNHHVIETVDPERLQITTADGRLLHAVRRWSDPGSDVAVVAISERDVPAARLGDSDKLQIGHWVLAIGSPFDLAGSLTHGIVSGKGRRSLRLGKKGTPNVLNQDFIQTDAPINPGNSGGPLVNLRGEVVGLNTAIASQSGGSEGVGFSIPINLVRRIAVELIQKGSITRAYLGIGLEPPLDPVKAAKLGLPRARGALVQEVYPDTPAAQAGVEDFDVVLEFNGRPVEDMEHLTHMISMTPVGQEVSLVLWRNRQEKKLSAKVGDRSKFDWQRPSDRVRFTVPKLGFVVQELTPSNRTRFELGDVKGVLVTNVNTHSPVAQQIEPFDVIYQIDGRSIASVADVRDVVKTTKIDEGLRVRVVRTSPQGTHRVDLTLKP